jgi:hypothetical protein
VPVRVNCPAVSSVIRDGSGTPPSERSGAVWRAAAERGRNVRLQFLLRMGFAR